MPAAAPDPQPPRRRWRDYRTASGRSPVGEFISSLPDREAASVLGGMQEVRDRGLAAARHLQDDIWEVRVHGNRAAYRVLFAPEGERGRVLLGLEAFSKKTRKTPDRSIDLAMRRLADWRRRGSQRRPARGIAPRQARGISSGVVRPSPLRPGRRSPLGPGSPTRGLDR
jgi:phage-related protein